MGEACRNNPLVRGRPPARWPLVLAPVPALSPPGGHGGVCGAGGRDRRVPGQDAHRHPQHGSEGRGGRPRRRGGRYYTAQDPRGAARPEQGALSRPRIQPTRHRPQAPPSSKVPRFYLVDSIVKNHRDPYAELFAARIVPTFCETYDSVRKRDGRAAAARVENPRPPLPVCTHCPHCPALVGRSRTKRTPRGCGAFSTCGASGGCCPSPSWRRWSSTFASTLPQRPTRAGQARGLRLVCHLRPSGRALRLRRPQPLCRGRRGRLPRWRAIWAPQRPR